MKLGFFGLLTIVFIVLKVIGQIDWSWWLVVSPLAIGIIVHFVIIALIIATASTKIK